MNAIAEIERQSATDLVVDKVLTPAAVFAPGGVDAILKKISDEVAAFKPDISTASGRKAIASIAHKVARSKTALDDMGKDLASEWKAKANAVDAERRTIRETLDALKEKVRKPLTDWEEAEESRVNGHESALEQVRSLASFAWEPTVDVIDANRLALEEHAKRDWQEFATRAMEVIAQATVQLDAKRAEVVKREAERAELERLRREQAEREQRERDERIAAEAAARAKAEAELRAAREAAEIARKAEQERQRVEREKTEAVARAERAEAEKVAAAARAEREKKEAVEAERRRAAAAKAAEEAEAARREANKKHVAKIHSEAAAGFVRAGLTQDHAKAAVTAIAQDGVPHVSISY